MGINLYDQYLSEGPNVMFNVRIGEKEESKGYPKRLDYFKFTDLQNDLIDEYQDAYSAKEHGARKPKKLYIMLPFDELEHNITLGFGSPRGFPGRFKKCFGNGEMALRFWDSDLSKEAVDKLAETYKLTSFGTLDKEIPCPGYGCVYKNDAGKNVCKEQADLYLVPLNPKTKEPLYKNPGTVARLHTSGRHTIKGLLKSMFMLKGIIGRRTNGILAGIPLVIIYREITVTGRDHKVRKVPKLSIEFEGSYAELKAAVLKAESEGRYVSLPYVPASGIHGMALIDEVDSDFIAEEFFPETRAPQCPEGPVDDGSLDEIVCPVEEKLAPKEKPKIKATKPPEPTPEVVKGYSIVPLDVPESHSVEAPIPPVDLLTDIDIPSPDEQKETRKLKAQEGKAAAKKKDKPVVIETPTPPIDDLFDDLDLSPF